MVRVPEVLAHELFETYRSNQPAFAGDHQRIAYLAHFDQDEQGGNPRKGWTEVLVLRDLAELMPGSTMMKANGLFDVWGENWSGLGADDQAVAAIDNAINDLRQDIVATLKLLD
jgi:hypothetical protein